MLIILLILLILLIFLFLFLFLLFLILILILVLILLILAIGGVLNTGYEQQLLMSNDSILNYSDVLDTYAYRYGLKNGMYSGSISIIRNAQS